jgi:hypothetical protein
MCKLKSKKAGRREEKEKRKRRERKAEVKALVLRTESVVKVL